MLTIKIFRPIAVAALVAIIGIAAQQKADGQPYRTPDVVSDTIGVIPQPADASPNPGSTITTTVVKDSSNTAIPTDGSAKVTLPPNTTDTVDKDTHQAAEYSGIYPNDSATQATAGTTDSSAKNTTAAIAPQNGDPTADSLTTSISASGISADAHSDSGVSIKPAPIPKPDSTKQPDNLSHPAADSLMNLLYSDFGMPTLDLTLDEAINYLLRFNPLVTAARLEWMANEQKALASLGPFEPAIIGGYRYNETRYNYRPFPEQNLEQSVGLKGHTISGTEYSFDFRVTDVRNTRSSLELPQAFTGVTLTQPLLRNAWNGSEIADRKIAIIEREAAFHTYRSKLIEMIAELQSAYWNLAFAQEKYRFALQSLKIAEKIVTDAKLRLKTGKMSMVDLIEAEAGLAARQANIADARQELLDAANQLKLMLSTDDIGKDRLLYCTKKIFVDDSERPVRAHSDSIGRFDIKNHPEFRIRRLELDKEAVVLSYRTGQCLPGLNAKGSCGINGYGSKTPSALNRLLHDPQPAWSAMLELELPVLGGVESRNLLAAQKFKKEAAQKNLSAIEYQITNTMRIITQRVAAHCELARNAGLVVDFRQRLLDIEFKKLDAGKSTYRLIYETEEKLSEAKQSQLESNVRYRMAIVQQAKITGSMLADFGLETVDRGRVILKDMLTKWNGYLKTPGNQTK
jgi:outer membrane protein TolC